jgi:hypothetical protein
MPGKAKEAAIDAAISRLSSPENNTPALISARKQQALKNRTAGVKPKGRLLARTIPTKNGVLTLRRDGNHTFTKKDGSVVRGVKIRRRAAPVPAVKEAEVDPTFAAKAEFFLMLKQAMPNPHEMGNEHLTSGVGSERWAMGMHKPKGGSSNTNTEKLDPCEMGKDIKDKLRLYIKDYREMKRATSPKRKGS